MYEFRDQLNQEIQLIRTPQRIVSLVPSLTELLADLGLEEEVIGITKFCVHPDKWFRDKARIGGTKNVNIDRVTALSPDLIIANKEENVQEQVDALRSVAPVWVSDVNDIDSAIDMIHQLGLVTGKPAAAGRIITQLQTDFSELKKFSADPVHKKYKVAYLIWKDPYMTTGADTFIHDILQKCSWENIFQDRKRYPETHIKELQDRGAELVLLSSEPYPFQQKHIEELKEQIPAARLLLVDGEMFSWYGSRLLHTVDYLKKLMTALATD